MVVSMHFRYEVNSQALLGYSPTSKMSFGRLAYISVSIRLPNRPHYDQPRSMTITSVEVPREGCSSLKGLEV